MTIESRIDALDDRAKLLWIAAVLLYGVGDTATTFWGLSTGGVAEAGPIARPLIDAYGPVALVGIKVVVFVSFYAAWRVLETPGRVAIPLALAVVGAAVTGWNTTVVLTELVGWSLR